MPVRQVGRARFDSTNLNSGHPGGGMDEPAAAALRSFFSVVGLDLIANLLSTSRQRTARAGEVLVHEGQADRPGVLIDGQLRTAVSLADGRMATIHYSAPVEAFGLPTIFRPAGISVHAVRTAIVIELDAEAVRRAAHESPEFAWFLSGQLAAEVGRVASIVEGLGFKTVVERIAFHLIRLSQRDSLTGWPTAYVTQAELAEYVGSVREVVSRCLRSLSDERIVAIGRGSLRVIDEAQLRRLAGE